MTYNELKTRLTKVENALNKLKKSKDKKHTPEYIKETTVRLNIIKENQCKNEKMKLKISI